VGSALQREVLAGDRAADDGLAARQAARRHEAGVAGLVERQVGQGGVVVAGWRFAQ
jgi:hypothetical protein